MLEMSKQCRGCVNLCPSQSPTLSAVRNFVLTRILNVSQQTIFSMTYRRFCSLARNFGFFRILQRKASSKSVGRVKREAAQVKEHHAFSDEFEEKIRSWKKLLQLEIREEKLLKENSEISSLLKKCEFKPRTYIAVGLLLKGWDFFSWAVVSRDEFIKICSSCRGGTPMLVFYGQSDVGAEAVVMEVKTGSIKLLLKNTPVKVPSGSPAEKVRLELGDSSTLQSVLDLLYNREAWLEYPGYKLLLYTYRAVLLPTMSSDPKISELNSSLNDDQILAVRAALNPDRPITAIHGPPGTGKTKVIAEIVAQLIARNKKVLVCAPSHKAVSNVLKNCYERGIRKYCKVYGEESEISNNFHKLIESRDFSGALNDVYRRMDSLVGTDDKKKLGGLSKEARKMQLDICRQISVAIQVIFCTMTTLSVGKVFDVIGFEPDMVIIDEAGQAMECQTWLMLFKAKQIVVVGDHHQLPAVVYSGVAQQNGLGMSLIEWISQEFGSSINFPLKVQYRFNNAIQSWPNAQFYGGMLKAHHSVSNIHLKDILKGDQNNQVLPSIVDNPLVLVNTDLYTAKDRQMLSELFKMECGADLFRERFLTPSIYNMGEAMICALHLKSLERRLLLPSQIACITPYLAQVHSIKSFLSTELVNDLEISSVDAFQGQEREAVVMSFVRKNWDAHIGFMKDFRRLNVAVTRAKRQFLLIASLEMLNSDPTLRNLLRVIQLEGEIVPPSRVISASITNV